MMVTAPVASQARSRVDVRGTLQWRGECGYKQEALAGHLPVLEFERSNGSNSCAQHAEEQQLRTVSIAPPARTG